MSEPVSCRVVRVGDGVWGNAGAHFAYELVDGVVGVGDAIAIRTGESHPVADCVEFIAVAWQDNRSIGEPVFHSDQLIVLVVGKVRDRSVGTHQLSASPSCIVH